MPKTLECSYWRVHGVTSSLAVIEDTADSRIPNVALETFTLKEI